MCVHRPHTACVYTRIHTVCSTQILQYGYMHISRLYIISWTYVRLEVMTVQRALVYSRHFSIRYKACGNYYLNFPSLLRKMIYLWSRFFTDSYDALSSSLLYTHANTLLLTPSLALPLIHYDCSKFSISIRELLKTL